MPSSRAPSAVWTDFTLGPPPANTVTYVAIIAGQAWVRAATPPRRPVHQGEHEVFEPEQDMQVRGWIAAQA